MFEAADNLLLLHVVKNENVTKMSLLHSPRYLEDDITNLKLSIALLDGHEVNFSQQSWHISGCPHPTN